MSLSGVHLNNLNNYPEDRLMKSRKARKNAILPIAKRNPRILSAITAAILLCSTPFATAHNNVFPVDAVAAPSLNDIPFETDAGKEVPFSPVRARFVSVSLTMGDIGEEVSRMVGASAPGLDTSAEIDLIYANVDEADLNDQNDGLMTALHSAAALRRTIFLDSAAMDRNKVAEISKELFGETSLRRKSYLLLAKWDGVKWQTLQTFDAIAPSLGRVVVAHDSYRKALGGTHRMPLSEFAMAGYGGDLYVKSSEDNNKWYKRAYRSAEGNITLYRGNDQSSSKRCVLVWRNGLFGSDWSDWEDNNWESMLWEVRERLGGYLRAFHYSRPGIQDLRVGNAYEARFNTDLRSNGELRGVMDTCNHFRLAGHGVGGGLAMYTAFVWSYENPNFWYGNLHRISAFNAPPVGNARYLRDFRSRVVGQKQTHNYCRSWDPVSNDTPDFPRFCTFTGDDVSKLPSWEVNHAIDLWTQCRSATSC